MGCEYMVEFDVHDPDAVTALLRGIAGFEHHDPQCDLYTYRRRATGRMPDAHAKLEPGGVYLCDNGCGDDVVRDIHAALSAVDPAATTREL